MVDIAPRASIVICTRNRSEQLGEVCQELLRIGSAASFEVLVVDNGSTDDTAARVESLHRRNPRIFAHIFEARPGLSRCRNLGVRHSRGEVVVFLDDDAYPSDSWLDGLLTTFEHEPRIMAAGGPVEPRLEGELPGWFEEGFMPYLSAWDRGDKVHDLGYNEYPRGANVAFRRSAFERYGGFLEELGRRGDSLRSGEETEFCLRIERGGDRIVYVPTAAVEHLVHGERITQSWLVRRFRAQGLTEALIDWRHGGWPAIRQDLAQYVRNLLAVYQRHDGAGAALRRSCQRSALWGYLSGVPIAVATLPRYPTDGSLGWRPVRTV